jgi:hypothetical protein
VGIKRLLNTTIAEEEREIDMTTFTFFFEENDNGVKMMFKVCPHVRELCIRDLAFPVRAGGSLLFNTVRFLVRAFPNVTTLTLAAS